MPTSINVEKTESTSTSFVNPEINSKIQDMEKEIQLFFSRLDCPNSEFSAQSAFDELLRYTTNFDRILYSTISNIIYAKFDSERGIGTILSNLDALVKISEDPHYISEKKTVLSNNQSEKAVDDTRKAILKIWDHVSLANQQYIMLKQSDEEYDLKFKARISTYKEEMTKEMNAQMITMVGIFTALAFLIFGSISSLDGIFENIEMPIFKVMCIGLIWGIGISNMIFVFLYCIGKMTKLSFKANPSPEATIFQRYPIVWWTNFFLISLLLITSWGHFIQQTEIGKWLLKFTNGNHVPIFWIGTIAILVIIILAVVFLINKTTVRNKNRT